MKFLALALTTLPLLALANPIAEPDAAPEPEAELEKRAITCTTTACDIKYHVEPNTSSGSTGQISGCNQKVSLSCQTTGTGSGASVNGNNKWDKIASGPGVGRYITDYYIKCPSALPKCT